MFLQGVHPCFDGGAGGHHKGVPEATPKAGGKHVVKKISGRLHAVVGCIACCWRVRWLVVCGHALDAPVVAVVQLQDPAAFAAGAAAHQELAAPCRVVLGVFLQCVHARALNGALADQLAARAKDAGVAQVRIYDEVVQPGMRAGALNPCIGAQRALGQGDGQCGWVVVVNRIVFLSMASHQGFVRAHGGGGCAVHGGGWRGAGMVHGACASKASGIDRQPLRVCWPYLDGFHGLCLPVVVRRAGTEALSGAGCDGGQRGVLYAHYGGVDAWIHP